MIATAFAKPRACGGRLRGDQGTALVEFALILPLLTLLVIGVAEFGFAWKDTLTITAAARSGARTESFSRNTSLADFSALAAVKAGLGRFPNSQVNYIMIYNASAVDGEPDPQCLLPASITAGGVAGLCNIYTTVFYTAFSATDSSAFTGSCSTGTRPDRFWCPTDRKAEQYGSAAISPPDYVGVQLSVGHKAITGIFGPKLTTLTERAVVRLEPSVS